MLAIASAKKRFIVVEMNAGQMVEDVRLAVNGKSEVLFYGRPGGAVFNTEELHRKIKAACPRSAGANKRLRRPKGTVDAFRNKRNKEPYQ